MEKPINKKLLDELNDILRRELGSAPNGEGLYKWEWSEDLFWPAYETGQMVTRKLDSGLWAQQKEYRRDRMTHKYRDVWIATKWIPPGELDGWLATFPGAPYPANGYRIFTNAFIPKGQFPTRRFTEHLIRQVNFQRSPKYDQSGREIELTKAWEEEQLREEELRAEQTKDMIGNDFTAFLNPTPGKRGGSVSTQAGIGESPVLSKLIVEG